VTAQTDSKIPVLPIKLEQAYSNRPAVWRTVVGHSPYPLMAGSKGYGELMGNQPLYPFFRSVWAHNGKALDDETRELLHYERFSDAAGSLFGARVVRPTSLIVNIMGPMEAGATHVDAPTFRGLTKEIPIWLPVLMGMSGLFDRWTVRVAGVLTWFYDNVDGEFEYWPSGNDAQSELERAPFGNTGLVADNDLMPHRVRRIGDATSFNRKTELTPSSSIHAVDGNKWEIRDGDSVLGVLGNEDVRVSLLWKAITFSDERAAQIYDDHEDDLTVSEIVSTICADVARRGLPAEEPTDPLHDPEWAKVLAGAYLPARI
jgi:hypothetical protein